VKVQLREIPCRKTFDLDASFVGKALAGLPIRAALERPEDDSEAGSARAELELSLESQNVFARGNLSGSFEVACSRCLGVARIPVAESIAVTFLPKNAMPADKDEELAPGEEEAASFEEDDVDVYPYDGEEVDLEPLLREQLILAVPFAPLCRPDCKGLCPVCGTDLNRETCACDRRTVDPRLAALKDLKV
jgi:uncharacterized protein